PPTGGTSSAGRDTRPPSAPGRLRQQGHLLLRSDGLRGGGLELGKEVGPGLEVASVVPQVDRLAGVLLEVVELALALLGEIPRDLPTPARQRAEGVLEAEPV